MTRLDHDLVGQSVAVGAGEGGGLDARLGERRPQLADVHVHPTAVAGTRLQQRRRVERDHRGALHNVADDNNAAAVPGRPGPGNRRSVGKAVDVGFAVAVATHEFGAERVELVEAGTSIGGDPRLELGDRLGQRERAARRRATSDRPRPLVAQSSSSSTASGWSLRSSVGRGGRAGPPVRWLDSTVRSSSSTTTSAWARRCSASAFTRSRRACATRRGVRHGVVLELQLLAQAAEFVQREARWGRASGSWSRGSSGHGWQDRHLVMLADGGVDRDVLAVHPDPAGAEHLGEPWRRSALRLR